MAEETVVEAVVEQPVEKKYIYQPTDENNRPIGGKQVIKYFTHEELAQKLQEQNVLLIRKLRKETRNNRLGILENETIPDDAQRFAGTVEFAPRVLNDDERFDLSRKLLDPVTAIDAMNTLIEASMGAAPQKVGSIIQELQLDNVKLRAKIEADAFVADNPEYYKCQENTDAITSWMLRYDLAPVKENFQKAYETLLRQDLLVQGPAEVVPVTEEPDPVETVVAPVVEPTATGVEPVVEVVREALPTTEVVVRGVASGLNRENSSEVGITPKTGSSITYEFVSNGEKKVLTGLQAIQAMPGDEYKRRLLTDKNFGKEVDKLESEARKKG